MWRTVVRLDKTRSPEFSQSRIWNMSGLHTNTLVFENGQPGDRVLARSFSGSERNRLFLQDENNFTDVSLISGMDFKEDGRGFSIFDFDHDGWLDLAITSPNFPRFRIVKNKFSEQPNLANRKSVLVSLVGGADSSMPQTDWSSRDAIGARIEVEIGNTVRAFQSSCGEGLSSQNSSRVHVGMGTHDKIDRLTVHWPSGKKTSLTNLNAGSTITVREKVPSMASESQE